MRLEAIEHARFRALAQIYLDKDKGVEAFEEYMKVAFPYLEATKKKDREVALKELNQWIGKGAFKVTPIAMPKMRSKLKARLVERSRPQTKEEADKLYKKLGPSIPL